MSPASGSAAYRVRLGLALKGLDYEYAAVDLAEEKLGRQLVRHKQKLTDHHRGQESMGTILPGTQPPTGGPAPAREETYEEIVEKMKEQDDES